MNIKTTFTNIDASPAVEEYVFKKMSSLSKFIDHDEVLCEVELGRTTNHHRAGDIYKAEINITYKGKQFYVVADKDDLYAAIDEMRDEIERVIVSYKKKSNTLIRRGASKIKNLVKRLYNK